MLCTSTATRSSPRRGVKLKHCNCDRLILTGGRKSAPRIVEDGDCGTLLPLTDVEYVEDTSEKAAAAAIGGGGGRADDGLKLVDEVVSDSFKPRVVNRDPR